MLRMKSHLILTILVLSLLSGCQTRSTPIGPPPGYAANTSVIKETAAFTPASIMTGTLQVTAIPSVTARFTRTATSVFTPTWTPLPTLQDSEAKVVLNRLLNSNGDCELPCVWGMIPGQTTWFEVQQFLQSFLKFGGANGIPEVYMEVDYVPKDKNENLRISISVEEYQILGFQLSPAATAARYRVEDILARYGEPEEVYIGATTGYPVKDLLPFDLIIYYPKYGFSALFNYNAENTGSHLRVCPADQPIGPTLDVWDPHIELTLKDIYPAYFEFPNRSMLTVEEALGMDKEQFTQTFDKEDTGSCMSTPVELW